MPHHPPPVALRASTSPSRGEVIGAAEFSHLISRLGPFENRPHVAVAVSGGPDSMALCLLVNRWARARRGSITALTVDHGLRPESASEARQVARWCRARGIAHVTLRWKGTKPTTGIQAAARAARYALMEGWCALRGVLHLLLAHHADDQAETVALRRERGSGEDGLAGMAAVVEMRRVRLLRPLLGVPKSRLIATLVRARQGWFEDPSNRDPRFGRVRVRGRKPPRPTAGARRRRSAREAKVAALLSSAWVHPSGWVEGDAGDLTSCGPELGRRALARLLMCVGGAEYPPPTDKLDRLWLALAQGRLASARTLAACCVLVRGDRFVVMRERGREGAVKRPAQPLVPARFSAV